MSLHFVCPACSAPVSVGGSIPDACPHCKAPLPDPLKASLAAGREREGAPIPFLLMLGRYGSSFMGGMMLLLLLLAPWDVGSYSINNEPVSGPEFLRIAGLGWGVLCIDLLAVAYALWTERWWGRWVMLGYWVLGAAMMLALPAESTAAAVSGALMMLMCGGVAAWYLFGNENVVRYYKALEQQADASEKVVGG